MLFVSYIMDHVDIGRFQLRDSFQPAAFCAEQVTLFVTCTEACLRPFELLHARSADTWWNSGFGEKRLHLWIIWIADIRRL
jgi:hypothetical protein